MRMVLPARSTGRFINELTSDMNAIVESLFGDETGGGSARETGFTPRMDVDETETAFHLSFDLPGVDPDEIEIKLDEQSLTIQGHRKQTAVESDNGKYRRVERTFGEYRRTIQLPKTVDKDAIEADYTDGVLTVVVPKASPVEARKVKIHRGQRNDILPGSQPSQDAGSTEETAADAAGE